jgi:hypothetical protein
MRNNSLCDSRWYLILPVTFLLVGEVIAADHLIPASTSTVDCGTLNGGIRPGDSVTLASGNRGPLIVRNCKGTSSNQILVRNDVTGSGPTVIRRTTAASGGWVFICQDCENVTIDGTGKWRGAPSGAYCGAPNGRNGCGIKVTSNVAGDSPSAYLKLNGISTRVTVRGVEIDGRTSELGTEGVGIDQNDHSVTVQSHPGFWREGFVYEKNYVHDVFGEGLYIGPNWREPDLRAPLRNITIRENLVERTGRQNIQLKSAIDGASRIHHNVTRHSGLRGEEGQGAGISIFEGGQNVMVYNNWVEASGIQGIQHHNMYVPQDKGPFTSHIYNNVIVDSGQRFGADGSGHGIRIGSREGSANITASIFNNTVVNTSGNGVNFGSRISGGTARDNIVANAALAGLSLGDNEGSNNLVGSNSSIRFANAANLDFRLTTLSPARDAASRVGYPEIDFQGFSRPQGNAADQGAFEFLAEEMPKSPESINVD